MNFMSQLNFEDTFDSGRNEIVEIVPRTVWNSIPSGIYAKKEYPYPVKSVPLLAELSFYLGYDYWKKHPKSSQIWNEITSFFKSNPLEKSYQNYLDDLKEDVVEEKKSLIESQSNGMEEKKSSLLFDLKENCEKGRIYHKNYIDTLLTGSESTDYYKNVNVDIYLNDFIPNCTDAIVNDMSSCIHSDRLNPSLFIDGKDGRSYEEIAESIHKKENREKASEFHKLICIGLAVFMHPTRMEESKNLSPRKSESTFEADWKNDSTSQQPSDFK